MVENRKIISIPYNINPKWMGGVIYILNTIKILNWLDDSDRPIVRLFYRKELKRFVSEIKYPYLEAREVTFPSLKNGYLSSWLNQKNNFLEQLLIDDKTDAVFPLQDFPISYKKYPQIKLVSWYADLQHKHYPEFFSKKKLIERDLRIRLLLKNTNHLVLSSQDVLNDFNQFFQLENVNTYIYHFASVIDDFNFSNWDKVRTEKGLPKDYFLVSNQFHNHKNHKVIIEALAYLKKKGLLPTVAFTGKLPENTSNSYLTELRSLISKNKLEKQVVFLGVLSRQEQLSLMKYARAIIQPSLFEGWSTVIEDAISLQTPVIASNLAVNKEQLQNWAPYFNPRDYKELAKLIEVQEERKSYDQLLYEPYDSRIKNAAESFISIFAN